MKKQEYLERIKDLDRQKEEARELYIQTNAHAKEGDKVEVYEKRYGIEHPIFLGVAICGKPTDKYFFGNIDYNLVKIKKDGTASQHGFCAFDPILKVID